MKAQTKAKLSVYIGFVMGAFFFVSMMQSEPTNSLEELTKTVYGLWGMVFLVLWTYGGMMVGMMLLKEDRRKRGLRESWLNKDMDELEQRVAELENLQKSDNEKLKEN